MLDSDTATLNVGQFEPLTSVPAYPPVGAVPAVQAVQSPATLNSTNVSVNVAGPQIIYQGKDGPGLLVRGLWFICIGWWAGWIWITTAAVLNWTIIGLPLGIIMMNAVPKVMTLKSRNTRLNLSANADGTYTLSHENLEQHAFWVRALYFVFIGSWLSLFWAWTAWGIGLFIVTLPLSFWMFDRIPALTTLARY